MPERSTRHAWWLVALWLVVLLTGTSMPGRDIPSHPGFLDNVAHFSLYGMLAFLVSRAAHRGGWRGARLWLILPLISAFGALDELHQLFIPGRDAEVGDWMFDTAGAALGILAFTRIAIWRWASWLL